MVLAWWSVMKEGSQIEGRLQDEGKMPKYQTKHGSLWMDSEVKDRGVCSELVLTQNARQAQSSHGGF